MAKQKGNPGVQNRAIYSRASYLYQAASYLACRANQPVMDKGAPEGRCKGKPDTGGGVEDKPDTEGWLVDKPASSGAPKGKADNIAAWEPSEKQREALRNLSRHAIAEMRAVTLKTQIRQSQALKRTVCKFCDTLLLEGQTCRSTVENPSRGGHKPWADVLVVRCSTCGEAKRFPVCAPRQRRRALRLRTPEETRASAGAGAG